MILQNTNIERVLQNLKERTSSKEQILAEVAQILNPEPDPVEKITQKLQSKALVETNPFVFDLLETNRIYHIDQIQKICIDYRLRFLDSKYFKGKIPDVALDKIRQMESEHNINIEGFKIMAPSKLFKLEDKDDPLLFAPIGNGYFYLVHKWGNDLSPFRKILVWPFKNIVNLTALTLLISYMATLLVPNGLFSKNDSSVEFWIVYFFMFKSIAAVIIFYGFAQGKNFNPAIWNSKYFNA